jgi:hypothetical protein
MLYVTRKRTSTGEGVRSSRSSTRPARYEEQEKNVGVQRAERCRECGGGGRPKTSRERRVLEYRGLNVGGLQVQIRWISKEPCGIRCGGTPVLKPRTSCSERAWLKPVPWRFDVYLLGIRRVTVRAIHKWKSCRQKPGCAKPQ